MTLSELDSLRKSGNIVVLMRSSKKACWAYGRNCASVRIVRFLTAEREWFSRGSKAGIGWGERSGLESWVGKRDMRIDKMDRVSMSVSGGVES